MTSRELAEKIVTRFMTFSNSTDCLNYAESLLASALEEKKIVCVSKRGYSHILKDLVPYISQIKAEAYEECAKIAENRCQCVNHISIAYEIRQRAKELK